MFSFRLTTSLLFLISLTVTSASIQSIFTSLKINSEPSLFSCPTTWTIRCVLDKDWRNPVGNIGIKEFCQVGWRCNQCEEAKNTEECNETFPECHNECEAYSPIPF